MMHDLFHKSCLGKSMIFWDKPRITIRHEKIEIPEFHAKHPLLSVMTSFSCHPIDSGRARIMFSKRNADMNLISPCIVI